MESTASSDSTYPRRGIWGAMKRFWPKSDEAKLMLAGWAFLIVVLILLNFGKAHAQTAKNYVVHVISGSTEAALGIAVQNDMNSELAAGYNVLSVSCSNLACVITYEQTG